MRILFAGGGTAGHINPAIGIAEEVLFRDRKSSVAFVGRRGGAENASITKGGYKLYTMNVKGLERKLTLRNIKSLFLAVKAMGDAKGIIRDFTPDVIVGTGGYVSWPILRYGIKAGIPTVMHESNVYPGLVTRKLSSKCDLTLLCSEDSIKHLKDPKRTAVVGNPLRRGFYEGTRNDARRALGIGSGDILIVSFGGSLGSEAINNEVIRLMEQYSLKDGRIRHIHSAGQRYYEKIRSSYPKLTSGDSGCIIKEYIDDMPRIMSAADIVISRAGAMTLSEIARAAVPAILIPSPNVADNHQLKNAEALARKDAAVLIEESDLNERLIGTVKELAESAHLRKKLSKNVSALHKEHSAEKIYGHLLALTAK